MALLDGTESDLDSMDEAFGRYKRSPEEPNDGVEVNVRKKKKCGKK